MDEGEQDRIDRYPAVLRGLHWARAVLILGMICAGWTMTRMPDEAVAKFGDERVVVAPTLPDALETAIGLAEEVADPGATRGRFANRALCGRLHGPPPRALHGWGASPSSGPLPAPPASPRQ